MCRMFVMMGKENDPILRNNWLDSWYNAAKCDLRLPLAPEDCAHGDGWGLIQVNYKDQKLNTINRVKSTNPLYACDLAKIEHALDSSTFIKPEDSIILAHARKASLNMPKLVQQVHPFESFHYETQETTFLTHNGLVSKTILNNYLKNKIPDLTSVSDTQLLATYIQENMEHAPMSLELWSQIIKNIVNEHEKITEKYTMQIFLLTMGTEDYRVYASSAFGEYNPDVEKWRGYYTLYQCQNEKYTIFCSSTIADNFKENYVDDSWKIEPIENHTVIELKYTFKTGTIQITKLPFN